MQGAVLQSSRCTLRQYEEGDEAALVAVANDPLVTRWMTSTFVYPYTETDATEWIRSNLGKEPVEHFAIIIEGCLAGGIGVTPWHGHRRGVAEFGYWLGRQYWGKGFATEAGHLCVKYAFEKHALRRLESHVFEPNADSVRVIEKLGFSREAILRAGVVDREGRVLDCYLFAKLRT